MTRKIAARNVDAQRGELTGASPLQRGDAPGHFIGGEDDHTLDRDSVGRSAGALGRSGAHVSDVGVVLLIFVIVAVALTAIKRRR